LAIHLLFHVVVWQMPDVSGTSATQMMAVTVTVAVGKMIMSKSTAARMAVSQSVGEVAMTRSHSPRSTPHIPTLITTGTAAIAASVVVTTNAEKAYRRYHCK
jgi:hypothetical protein